MEWCLQDSEKPHILRVCGLTGPRVSGRVRFNRQGGQWVFDHQQGEQEDRVGVVQQRGVERQEGRASSLYCLCIIF